jgi:hypothetical protein
MPHHMRDVQRMPPGPMAKLKIDHFLGVISARCPCGSPTPMLIPVVPNGGGGYQCGVCQVVWHIEEILFSEPPGLGADGERPDVRVNVKARGVIPTIVQPNRIVG